MATRCSAESNMKSGQSSFLASCWDTLAVFPPSMKRPAVTVTQAILKGSQGVAQPIFDMLSKIHLDGPRSTFC